MVKVLERRGKRERKRELPSVSLLSGYPEQSILGKPKSRSRELCMDLPCGEQGHKHLGHSVLLSRDASRKLDHDCFGQDSNQYWMLIL